MNFNELFSKLTGYEPYPWQSRLHKKFLKGEFPDVLDIPTGLGKTSVMTIWLLALAESRSEEKKWIPTRLIYIVDRRVIVDQASEEAEKLQKKVQEINKIFKKEIHLNVSKLRGGGGMADNREWLKQPSVPAIIIGTIDMIGSRILFSGYGTSNKTKSLYAGLLGQDSLIILDETHIAPAMECVLRDVKKISGKVKDCLVPPKILLMSATQRSDIDQNRFTLDGDDLENDRIKQRYESEKMLELVKTDNTAQKIIDIASDIEEERKVLIYMQKPSDVLKVYEKLKKQKKDVIVLTGTMRGFERDNLASNEIMKKFLSKNRTSKLCFLVSTSAGEVGIDLDADDMICDLTTLDSLIQRLGRVNRSGGRKSKITVIFSEKDIKSKNESIKEKLENTRDILKDKTKKGKFNANPCNLEKIDPEKKKNAFAPMPEIQPLTPDIVNMWAMTSIYEQYKSRPDVKWWLRGKEERNIPDTYVAWRDDVQHIINLDEDKILEIFDAYRILPHETVRDYTNNVEKILKKIGEGRNEKVIIIKSDGSCKVKTINSINKEEIAFATIVVPSKIGGLNKGGLLDTTKSQVQDVADNKEYVTRTRVLEENEGDDMITKTIGDYPTTEINEDETDPKKNMQLAYSTTINTNDEDATKEICYYVKRSERQQSTAYKEQKLSDHLIETEKEAIETTKELRLSEEISEAIVMAAKFHDEGKKREHWQECMHVDKDKRPLAKTGRRTKPLPLGGFRHELASVIECSKNDNIMKCKESGLILHMIAAHHGWARPCFRPNALENGDPKEELTNVMIRYSDLQKRFGAWGLAWLEGLVRGADWNVSSIKENHTDHD